MPERLHLPSQRVSQIFESLQRRLRLACRLTSQGAITVQPNAGRPLSAGAAHREQEEQLGELALPEVVHKVLLGICAQAGNVAVLGAALLTQRKDALPHIL